MHIDIIKNGATKLKLRFEHRKHGGVSKNRLRDEMKLQLGDTSEDLNVLSCANENDM